MPDQSANLTALRMDGHKVRVYFGAFIGSVVFTATVDSTPADQALNLTVTAVSGSASDVKRGFQVRVYRADGITLKGVTNIRVIGTISATNLPIRELGQADIAIAAGDVVKVYNVPYLGDKLPSDDITFSPDGLTYSTEGSAIAPNCRSGGHRIGMADSGQTYRSEVMAGSGSGNLDPDSAALGTHLWVLLTATLAFAPGSAATDANPTLRANVGYGLAQHTYTDSSNSASWYQYVCFQVYDTDNPPIRVLDATIDGLEESGWSAEFETYASSALSDLPDGTLGALFVRETINGVDTSYGASIAGLSHVKCLGFLTHDESDLQSSIRRLRLRLQSPWQRLAGLPGFSKVITRATSADWTTVEGLTVKLGIFWLLHYYSFFTEMFDVIIDSAFLDKAYAQFFIQKLTADLQVKELAAGVDARVTNLRHGALSLHTHPCYIPLASRAAVTKTLTLAEQDMLSAGIVRGHWKTIETFEARGLTAGATDNDPLFSRYPGLTPGRGSVTVSADKKIWDDQDDANERCGRLAAKEDGTYLDSNHAYHRAVVWTPELFGSYDVFDFDKEYVATSLDAASNRRGVDLSAMLYYFSRTTIRYEGGTARATPTFLSATHASDGATYVPEPGEVAEYSPPDSVPIPFVRPASTIPPASGVQPTRALLFSTFAGEAKCALLTSLIATAGVFPSSDRSTGLTAGAEATAFTDDAWNYARVLKADVTNLQVCSDIETGAAWSTLTSIASLLTAGAIIHRLITDHKQAGYFGFCSGTNVYGYSTDNGVTWTKVSINGLALDYDLGGTQQLKWCDVCVYPHTARALYAIAPDPNDTTVGAQFKSTDNGATWTQVYTHGTYVFHWRFHVNIPYKRNGGANNSDNASMECWVGAAGNSGAGAKNYVFVSTDDLVSFATSFTGASSGGGLASRMPVNAYTHDAKYGWTVDGNGIINTADHWATPSASLLTVNDGQYADINLWPPDANNAIVCDASSAGLAHITNDFGTSWQSGLPSGFSGGVIGELSLFTVQ